MQLYILVYTSQSVEPVTSLSLKTLAGEAAQNNAQIDVTGLLLYGSGQFCQLLEGEKESVKALYQRIAKDERHRIVRVLFEAHSPRRLFPQWHMGQVNLDAPEGDDQMFWWVSAHQSQGEEAPAASAPPKEALAWVREFMDSHGSPTFGRSA